MLFLCRQHFFCCSRGRDGGWVGRAGLQSACVSGRGGCGIEDAWSDAGGGEVDRRGSVGLGLGVWETQAWGVGKRGVGGGRDGVGIGTWGDCTGVNKERLVGFKSVWDWTGLEEKKPCGACSWDHCCVTSCWGQGDNCRGEDTNDVKCAGKCCYRWLWLVYLLSSWCRQRWKYIATGAITSRNSLGTGVKPVMSWWRCKWDSTCEFRHFFLQSTIQRAHLIFTYHILTMTLKNRQTIATFIAIIIQVEHDCHSCDLVINTIAPAT